MCKANSCIHKNNLWNSSWFDAANVLSVVISNLNVWFAVAHMGQSKLRHQLSEDEGRKAKKYTFQRVYEVVCSMKLDPECQYITFNKEWTCNHRTDVVSNEFL